MAIQSNFDFDMKDFKPSIVAAISFSFIPIYIGCLVYRV